VSAAARSYYLVPRRGCQIAMALLLLLVLAPPVLAYLTAPRWMPAWPALLDAERPLANPDVVVVKASGENDDAVREAARLQRAGGVKQVAVLGLPFTPDNLAPPPRSRRAEELLAAGVPRAAVVEIRRGESVYEEMVALRDAAVEHGWRRILFHVDELSSRRSLVAADRIVAPGGREIGQRVFPLGWFDVDTWWQGGQPRTIVFIRTIQLIFTMLGNKTG
jgi:hypothetical protein